MIKINNSLIVFTLLSNMILFCSCNSNENKSDESFESRSKVSVIQPTLENITEYIQLNGVTVLQKKDNIRAINTGYITSLKFKQGDLIKTNQLFCMIGTKEQLALKSISSLDSSLNKFQNPLSVLSNSTGIITSINSLQGDYVSEGDILATVSEPSSLIVQVNVPYEYNQVVNVGKVCEIVLPDQKVIRTIISGAMLTVDASSQSQSYFIRLPNEILPENLNVSIRIPKHQKNNLLCLPTSAVQTDEMQKVFWVMKMVNDSMAIKVNVQTGLQNDSLTEIISDKIKVTDKIVYQGAYGLADSSIVLFNK